MAAIVAPLGSLVRFPPSRSACTVLRRTPILEQQQAWDVGSVCEGTPCKFSSVTISVQLKALGTVP